MINQDVSSALLDIAKIKKALNANKFSIGAYHKASVFVANLNKPINEIDFRSQSGIGDKIATHIDEYLQKGKIQFIIDNQHLLQADLKIEELLKIEGIGEKTATKIFRELGITTIVQLKTAIENQSIFQVLKEKSVKNIEKGIAYLEKSKGRIRLDQALSLTMAIYEYLKPHVEKIEVCGSVRRSKETIGDVDIAVASKLNILQIFSQMPIVDEIIDLGDKKASVWVNGVRVDCYLFTDDVFESGVMHLTGSADHNERLRVIAKSNGLILSQYGLYRRGTDDDRVGDRLDDGTEKGIYKLLGFEWIPPEHRDDVSQFGKYQLGNSVPLLKSTDIVYDFHVHSSWSDGSSSIEDNVKFAISQGFKGIAICDHSQSLKIAGGLSIDKLRERNQEIDVLRKKYPDFVIMKGSEVDIKGDGTLDYPDEVLDELDFVAAAIHTNVKKDVTEIYVKAVQSGKIDSIAHITGRLINDREGHELNVEEVLKACKEHDIAIELNCQPNRLDANENILKRCKELGIKITLGSDAHEMHQLTYTKTFGLRIAKRAWLTVENIYA